MHACHARASQAYRRASRVSTVFGIEEESTVDNNVIKLADRMPVDMRNVEPSTFLMSTDCRVNYILTVGNKLLDALNGKC
jgi:hypothetical protein